MNDESVRTEIQTLIAAHGLSFVLNPGGGEFYRMGWGRLQVPAMDSREDLTMLQAWVAQHIEVDGPAIRCDRCGNTVRDWTEIRNGRSPVADLCNVCYARYEDDR